MTPNHPDRGELLALLDGELTENRAREVREHVETCVACRAGVAEWKQLVVRAAEPVAARPGAEARVLALLDGPATVAARPAHRPFAWGTAAIAAAAAIALFVHRPAREPETFTPRGGAGAPSLARDVDVSLYADRNALAPLHDGDSLSADTPIAVSYRNLGAPAHALVFAVSDDGELHWIAPAYLDAAQDPAAIALAHGDRDVLLPDATALDAPGKTLRVFVVITADQARVSDVEQLGDLGRSVDLAALRQRWPAAEIRAFVLHLVPRSRP